MKSLTRTWTPVAAAGLASARGRRRLPFDMLALAGLFLAANAPLVFTGRLVEAWVFRPDRFFDGAWSALLLHPFVHVSAYHALLDGSACLLLYAALLRLAPGQRVGLFAASCAGALALPLLLAGSGIQERGLCGLSGAAHGLLCIVGLDMAVGAVGDRATRTVGWVVFALVTGKCVLETACGSVLFASLHTGDIGAPIASTHAGGVLGALAWRSAVRVWKRGNAGM